MLLSPRWWGVHLLVVIAALVMLRLGLWQWHRAESKTGGIQNFAYAFQWPLFAVFTLVLWWKTMRIEAAKLRGDDAVTTTGPLAGFGAQPLPPASISYHDGVRVGITTQLPDVDDEDEEVRVYNAYLARLNARTPARSHHAGS